MNKLDRRTRVEFMELIMACVTVAFLVLMPGPWPLIADQDTISLYDSDLYAECR